MSIIQFIKTCYKNIRNVDKQIQKRDKVECGCGIITCTIITILIIIVVIVLTPILYAFGYYSTILSGKDWDTNCYEKDFLKFKSNNISRIEWKCPWNDFCSKDNTPLGNWVTCTLVGIFITSYIIIIIFVIISTLYYAYIWIVNLCKEVKEVLVETTSQLNAIQVQKDN